MTKKLIYLTAFLLFISIQGYSQAWSRYKYEGYYGIGITNFMGDIPAPTPDNAIGQFVWVKIPHATGFTTNAGLRYNFANKQFLNGQIFLGQLRGKDPTEDPSYWDRGLSFQAFFMEITGKYEYQIIKEKKKSTVYRKLGESVFKNFSLPTYLFIGGGLIASYGSSESIVNEGRSLSSESYFNIAPVIPVGVGFKHRINRLTYLNVEISARLVVGDKVDNASGKESEAYGTWIDQYQTITFNLIHKLRQNQNGTPKFRRR